MQIEIKGYIYCTFIRDWSSVDPNATLTVYHFEATETFGDWVKICEHTVVVDLPEGFDPVTGQVAAWKDAITKTRADAQMKITEIEGRINRLLQLEYVPAAPQVSKRVVDADDVPFDDDYGVPF